MKPIKNEDEYKLALEWVDDQLDKKPDPESEEGNNLKITLLLIQAYEDARYQIPVPDPI